MSKEIKTIDDIVSVNNSPNIPDNSSLEKTKHSIKQRLGRLLMITEIKDKTLVPHLKQIKNEMFDNFCRTWVWKSEYINSIFRLYFNKDQDITIFKPQLQLFSQYFVSIPGVSESENIKVTQYIKTLLFIRKWLNPIIQTAKSFLLAAKIHALENMKYEDTEHVSTEYEVEYQKHIKDAFIKPHFQDSMLSQNYTLERFSLQKTTIADCFEQHEYQDLMIFALLWFHYFQKKSDVYDAFTSDQLDTLKISFTGAGFHPTTISLWVFLKIIEQLDFKNRLFSA